MRGVPRARRAISAAPSVSMGTPRMPGRPDDDPRQLVLAVEVQVVEDPEPLAEWARSASRVGSWRRPA